MTTAGISQGGINNPSFLTNEFNGQPAIRFSKSNSEALGKVLSSEYVGDFTIFLVVEGVSANPEQFDSFFSSWNNGNEDKSFQIDFCSEP